MNKAPQKTSWESSSDWYNTLVGNEGHYYHREVVLPGVLKLLELPSKSPASLLDLAAGQGVLARALPPHVTYTGVEIAPSFVKEGLKLLKNRSNSNLICGDATKDLDLKTQFTHGAILLALQNMEHPDLALKNLGRHLVKGGVAVLVLNHPCFRIPRQSSWGVDEPKKLQYRRLDRYQSSLSIPLQTHPGKENSASTISFHHPLTAWFHWIHEAGFAVTLLEEWVSNKVSTGANAKQENRARAEFPLFLALQLKRL
jgi:Methylase involved in ubiquinone/menaquinone biosynthesis